MDMLNLLNPQYARKQARQRWLYSAIAFACLVLGFTQFMYNPPNKTAEPVNFVVSTSAEVDQTAPLAADPVRPVIKQPEHDPCADLTTPNYEIAAIIWQQEGEKLILRTPQGRHFTLAPGQHLEQSSWKLQSIENSSIVWRDSQYFCRAEQALKAFDKQGFND